MSASSSIESVPFEILTDPNVKILAPTNADSDHDHSGCTDPTHDHHHLDQPDPEDLWKGNMKKMLPLPVLAALAANEMFGKKMEPKDENLFLSGLLDETQPLQSELVAKLNATFDANGVHPPDRISLQVFRRKAGFAPKKEDADMGRFCVAICLRDFQVISFNRKEEIVTSGNLSPIYELDPHPEKGMNPRPGVPKNRTIIKLPNGKALLKSREYLCFMAWAFWVDDPIKKEQPHGPIGVEQLQKMVKDLRARGENEQADEVEKTITQLKEPKPEGDGPTVPLYDAKTESSRLDAKMSEAELKEFRRPSNPMEEAGMILDLPPGESKKPQINVEALDELGLSAIKQLTGGEEKK